jgi:hypothetical protein
MAYMTAQKKSKTTVTLPPINTVEMLRINRAFQLAIFGLVLAAVLVIVLLCIGSFASTDIVAVVGLFTSVLGTLVGAFFGLQIGSADKSRAEDRADNAQKRVDVLQSVADQKTIQRAKREYADLFK